MPLVPIEQDMMIIQPDYLLEVRPFALKTFTNSTSILLHAGFPAKLNQRIFM